MKIAQKVHKITKVHQIIMQHTRSNDTIALPYCCTWDVYFAPQHGGVYLVTIDREFTGVSAPYVYVSMIE